MSYGATKSGILLPESAIDRGTRCAHCPNIIFENEEPKGRIHLDKYYKPICVRCRVLKGRKAQEIIHDRRYIQKDAETLEEAVQRFENERVAEIAAESIKGTNVGLTDN